MFHSNGRQETVLGAEWRILTESVICTVPERWGGDMCSRTVSGLKWIKTDRCKQPTLAHFNLFQPISKSYAMNCYDMLARVVKIGKCTRKKPSRLLSHTTAWPMKAKCDRIWCRRPVPRLMSSKVDASGNLKGWHWLTWIIRISMEMIGMYSFNILILPPSCITIIIHQRSFFHHLVMDFPLRRMVPSSNQTWPLQIHSKLRFLARKITN